MSLSFVWIIHGSVHSIRLDDIYLGWVRGSVAFLGGEGSVGECRGV